MKKGHYNDQIVTLLSGTYKAKVLTELEEPIPPQKSLTREVKELYHILYNVYSDRMKFIYDKIDVQKEGLKNV